MRKLLARMYGRFMNILECYPSEWSDPGRLSEWERKHLNPDGHVWALTEEDGRLELYPPGSPHPEQWPHGAGPYVGLRPVADCPQPPGFMPYKGDTLEALLQWVQREAAGTVTDHISGLRHVEASAPYGVPVMYLRVEPTA